MKTEAVNPFEIVIPVYQSIHHALEEFYILQYRCEKARDFLFSTNLQTGPPSSLYKWKQASFPGLIASGMELITHPSLAPRSRMCRPTALLLLCACTVGHRDVFQCCDNFKFGGVIVYISSSIS
jgi:hypothetical protein